MILTAGTYTVEITAVATTGQTVTHTEVITVTSNGVVPLGLINKSNTINPVLPFGKVIVQLGTVSPSVTLNEVTSYLLSAVVVELGLITVLRALGNFTSPVAKSLGVVNASASVNTVEARLIIPSATTLTAQDIDNIVDALFSRVIENGETFEQQLKLLRAEAAGKLSVTGTTVTIRDAADTKDRITATVDTSGQRTAVTTDAS